MSGAEVALVIATLIFCPYRKGHLGKKNEVTEPWRANHSVLGPRLTCRGDDLLPCFRTKLSMICAKERGRGYVEEQAHGGADDRGAETARGRSQSGGCGA